MHVFTYSTLPPFWGQITHCHAHQNNQSSMVKQTINFVYWTTDKMSSVKLAPIKTYASLRRRNPIYGFSNCKWQLIQVSALQFYYKQCNHNKCTFTIWLRRRLTNRSSFPFSGFSEGPASIEWRHPFNPSMRSGMHSQLVANRVRAIRDSSISSDRFLSTQDKLFSLDR